MQGPFKYDTDFGNVMIYDYKFDLFFFLGVNSRGLEYRAFPGDEKDKSLGGSILRCLDDLRQLRSFQPACCHPCRGIFKSGIAKKPKRFTFTYPICQF